MINAEIVNYIKNQLQSGVSQEKIKVDLQSSGWTIADINEAFLSLSNPINSNVTQSTNSGATNNPTLTYIAVISFIIILLAGAVAAFAYIKKIGPFKEISVAVLPSDNTQEEATPSENLSSASSSDNTIDTKVIESVTSPTTTISIDNSSSTIKKQPNIIKSAIVVNDTTDLWTIFDKLILSLKNKDIASYKKYSYSQVTPDQESQFDQFIPYLLKTALEINKSDYVNKWQDDKQAIYSTLPQKANYTDSYGYKIGVVMFVKKDGAWKVLSYGGPYWGITAITTVGGPKRTQVEADKKLQVMMIDSDKDGLTDMDERCEGAKMGDKQCVKTDPNKRDTNGNGWWDGIEYGMKE